MAQTRREFLRGTIGWGGLLLAGSLKLAATHSAEPLRKARQFFASQQSAEGAWRSSRYAAFRDGDVLTPVVLWALQPGGKADAVFDRGLDWLRKLTDSVRDRDEPWTALHYPLFTAGYAAQVLARGGDLDRAGTWVRIIEALRTSERLDWPAGDVMCGAWSDAASPPRYTTPIPDMLAPNISATALAVSALAAAGCPARGLTALPFIQSCQNFPAPPATSSEGRELATDGHGWARMEEGASSKIRVPSVSIRGSSENPAVKFDDGGFFFALGDPIRNKAGVAGHDAEGRERFRSYGSATCDGYLALRACGLAHDHPRVHAAREWLRQHCGGLVHGGDWPGSRSEAKASLQYYQAQALAAVLSDGQGAAQPARKLRASLTGALITTQRDDGTWHGLAPDSCEDEPLLATAFALRALSLLA